MRLSSMVVRLRSGVLPNCHSYLNVLNSMPPPNFSKNRTLSDPLLEAEVGGIPRLRLLSLILKRTLADAADLFLQKSDFKGWWLD